MPSHTYTFTDQELYEYIHDDDETTNEITDIHGGTSSGSSDTYELTTTDSTFSTAQIHVWGGWGNDRFDLSFSNITTYTQGHHLYGDFSTNAIYSDTFNFEDLDQVHAGGVVVGRLNDFDVSRDFIEIEGEPLVLTDLLAFNYSAAPSVASIRIVAYNGDHNDPNTQDQQWLLITTTSGGRIFYALEGARVDMTGNGGLINPEQEIHFVSLPSNIDGLPDVPYQPSNNYVPDGHEPETVNGQVVGVIYNDYDHNIADVNDVIGDESDEATEFGDLIAGGLNDDTIYGQGGNDMIWGGTGNDTVFGGTGNDTLRGGFGDDNLSGGSGNDWLIGGNGNDTLYGGTGTDNLRGNDGNDILYGDDGDDDLRGSNGDDILHGGAGNDLIYGGSDTDQLYGGDGNDTLRGENGNDLIEGGNGVDWLIGGNGNDTLEGGADGDYLRGNAGNDTLRGDDGDDDIRGGVGDDNLYGGAGNDTMLGGSDTDRMFGSVGDDNLSGENGNDTLYGENGTDILSGGNGNDILRGGRGNDTLTGDGGNDRFVFDVDSGADTITDFSVAGAETLDFSNIASITSRGNLAISYGATDTVIAFSGGSVTLEGTTAALLEDDFIF